MVSDAESYAQEIRSRWGQYLVDWPPGATLRIGDYGVVIKGVFHKEGNLASDYQVQFATDPIPPNPAISHYSHFSKDAVKVTFRTRGRGGAQAGAAVKAGLDLMFHKENSVFFNAAGCRVEMMSSPAMLRSRIMNLLDQGRWDYQWHVITRLIRSSSCTVLVASSGGATVSLDVNGNVPAVDLGDANLRMTVTSAEKMASDAVVTGDATPLLGCHRLKSKFLDGIKWTPARLAGQSEQSLLSGDKLAEAIKKGIVKQEEFEWVEAE
jgi:hypothetical protein